MYLVSCTNTDHDVTNLVKHGMVKNKKIRISSERNVTFLRNKQILNLRSYRFQKLSFCGSGNLNVRTKWFGEHLLIIAIKS